MAPLNDRPLTVEEFSRTEPDYLTSLDTLLLELVSGSCNEVRRAVEAIRRAHAQFSQQPLESWIGTVQPLYSRYLLLYRTTGANSDWARAPLVRLQDLEVLVKKLNAAGKIHTPGYNALFRSLAIQAKHKLAPEAEPAVAANSVPVAPAVSSARTSSSEQQLSFAEVRHFDTLLPVSATIDPSHILFRTDYTMTLLHPQGNWDEVEVEALLLSRRDSIPSSLALCHRSRLLFPEFRHGDLIVKRRSMVKGAIVLASRDKDTHQIILHPASASNTKGWERQLSVLFGGLATPPPCPPPSHLPPLPPQQPQPRPRQQKQEHRATASKRESIGLGINFGDTAALDLTLKSFSFGRSSSSDDENTPEFSTDRDDSGSENTADDSPDESQHQSDAHDEIEIVDARDEVDGLESPLLTPLSLQKSAEFQVASVAPVTPLIPETVTISPRRRQSQTETPPKTSPLRIFKKSPSSPIQDKLAKGVRTLSQKLNRWSDPKPTPSPASTTSASPSNPLPNVSPDHLAQKQQHQQQPVMRRKMSRFEIHASPIAEEEEPEDLEPEEVKQGGMSASTSESSICTAIYAESNNSTVESGGNFSTSNSLRSLNKIIVDPQPNPPGSGLDAGIVRLFKGPTRISHWKSNRWMPLRQGSFVIEVTVSGEGGRIHASVFEEGKRMSTITFFLTPKTEVRKSTHQDVQLLLNNGTIMFRFASKTPADRFCEAVLTGRKDLSDQPLLYGGQVGGKIRSVHSYESGLSSFGSGASFSGGTFGSVSVAPSRLHESPSMSWLSMPPSLSPMSPVAPSIRSVGAGSPGPSPSSPFVGSPGSPLLSQGPPSLLLLNKTKCLVFKRLPGGQWGEKMGGRLSVYSMDNSNAKRIVIADAHAEQIHYQDIYGPACFERNGKTDVVVKQEDQEMGRILLRFKKEKQTRQVFELLSTNN